ncbi:MAG: response regulator [Rhodospirillales bacterium]
MARIIVADDQAAVRHAVRAILEPAGHVVAEAANGRDALGLLADGCDLLITDVLMPEMDGLELLRHAKRRRPDLPVLVVTGGWRGDNLDLLSMAFKLGADRTLGKANIVKELAGVVAAMTEQRVA